MVVSSLDFSSCSDSIGYRKSLEAGANKIAYCFENDNDAKVKTSDDMAVKVKFHLKI
jgi:hypothetical protein